MRLSAEETLFLSESNHIENVWDDDSLEQAKLAWSYLKKQKELTLGVILKTHKILMLHQPLRPDEKGYLRKRGVWIGGREGLAWQYLPEAMEVWRLNAWLYPEHWKDHHIRYEEIHPFIDGNGRTGRMFMNWERLKNNLPLLTIYNSKKTAYYSWFQN